MADLNITIPPKALMAARAASMNALGDGEDAVKAACLAMLNAWPGMAYRVMPYEAIILPLNTEPINDK
jgi:predicted RNA polymerase sigma factor